MEKRIVNKIFADKSLKHVPEQHKQKVRSVLLKHFKELTITAKELGFNIEELWHVYISKCEYNQLDTRERRHIMYDNQEEKNQLIEKEKTKLRNEFLANEHKINGYDMVTQQIREIDKENEYALVFFHSKEEVDTLSTMVPPYIKFKVFKCHNLYLVDIPNQCINKFPGLFILLVPKKKTVLIGIDGYSPIDEIKDISFKVGSLYIAFIEADKAEEIDETHINKFWFYENYNPKRKYHFIYSNSRKVMTH